MRRLVSMIPYADLHTPPLSPEKAAFEATALGLPDPLPGISEVRDGLLRIVTRASPLLMHLEGEADLSGRDLLATALQAAIASSAQDLHVDLGGLDFIDVGNLLLLRQAEQELIRRGRSLWMYEVPAVARRAMRLVGWEMPGEEP